MTTRLNGAWTEVMIGRCKPGENSKRFTGVLAACWQEICLTQVQPSSAPGIVFTIVETKRKIRKNPQYILFRPVPILVWLRRSAAIRGLRIAAVWSNLMSRQAKFELELTNVDELKEKRYSRLGHKAGHGWTKCRRMTFPDSLQDTGTCSS